LIDDQHLLINPYFPMPKPIAPNTICKHPDYTAKTAPKKGAGKRVQASKSPSPKAAQQPLLTTASKSRPEAKFQQEESKARVYRTKGTAPLPQYAGLSKKEFTLLKEFFMVHQNFDSEDAEWMALEILKNKDTLHEFTFQGKTLFELAVKTGNSDVAKLLLKHGDIPTCSADAKQKVWSCILLQKGPDNQDWPEPDFELARLLAKNPEWKNELNSGTKRNFVFAVLHSWSPHVLKVVKFLNKNGVNFNVQDHNNKCPELANTLTCAITKIPMHDREALVTYLLSKCHANVNARNLNYQTPLMACAESCSISILKILLDSGANPSITFVNSTETVLDFLLKSNNPPNDIAERVALLLQHWPSSEGLAELEAKYNGNPIFSEAKRSLKNPKSARKV
jgi:ankyrin repeat protein